MDKNEPAVVIKDLHKTFRLPHENFNGIKQKLVHLFEQKRGYEIQHVLKGVSFEVEKGEFFGIVGRNGSGKSTLLKLIAGIYAPDEGLIQINGTLTPFIELGVGFNPELTGRENVYLNGALLGFSREEMRKMYNDIVSFAELKDFMDQKLKNYSSGMQVRLAFSIAIRAKTDILLIDEVLAVGDESFQRKCMEYFIKLKRKKQTVIFITHDMGQVRRFCDRAMYIEKGEIVAIGKTSEIANLYIKNNLEVDEPEEDQGGSVIGDQSIMKVHYATDSRINSGEDLHIKIEWQKGKDVRNVGVAISKDTGEYVFGTNTILDGHKLEGNSVAYKVTCNLAPGKYSLAIGLFGETDADVIAYNPGFTNFAVDPSPRTTGWGGIVELDHKWG